LYDGSHQTEPVRVLDLILTNETEYTPWSSMRNGREGKRLGEVSVAANTDTRFKFRFADSNDTDGTPVAVAYGFDFCLFDIDTGVGGSLVESVEACGSLNYFHHGGGKNGIPEGRGYLCDNIKVDGYLEITTPSAGCTLVTGLREGTGADNPATWDDVVVDPDGDLTCEAYDMCPSSGVSGFARGPGDRVVDIQTCATDGSEEAGLFPSSIDVSPWLRGKPMRYTMPKFVCFTFPAGTSSFELTYRVGLGASAPYYGRNFFFSGASVIAPDDACGSSPA